MDSGGLETTFVASEKGKTMAKNCMTCTEVCKQAEMAHQIALGRMYATNELISILKKIDNCELVEVVRCKDCKHSFVLAESSLKNDPPKGDSV